MIKMKDETKILIVAFVLPLLLAIFFKNIEAVPQINYRTLLYTKTMTVNQHKSEIHDTPGVNTNKILKNCYLRCNLSYQTLNIT